MNHDESYYEDNEALDPREEEEGLRQAQAAAWEAKNYPTDNRTFYSGDTPDRYAGIREDDIYRRCFLVINYMAKKLNVDILTLVKNLEALVMPTEAEKRLEAEQLIALKKRRNEEALVKDQERKQKLAQIKIEAMKKKKEREAEVRDRFVPKPVQDIPKPAKPVNPDEIKRKLPRPIPKPIPIKRKVGEVEPNYGGPKWYRDMNNDKKYYVMEDDED